ncbi:MAG TPA: hypothetical protein VFS48_07590 [Solirubrobacterales bacterium]|nr:hypothetical protein [Solirubrobacterales bacterium]
MTLKSSRSPFHLSISLLVAAVAALGLIACGDAEETQSLTFTLSGDGKSAKISGPQSADTGLAEITLKNDGKGEGDLQLIRVEGDHSAEDAIKGLEAAMQGKAFPDWFFAAGGTGTTAAGKSQTVTQVLEPGTYYAFNTEGDLPEADSVPVVEVSGETSDETVEADETVDAFEYGFEADQLSAGQTEIAFDNTGAQPHHLLAAPLTGDATADDVAEAFKSEKGKPPFDEKGFQSTAVLEGGEGQLVTLDLKPGRYVLFCFITDRQGGPPHALKGMVDEVEVR